jgi:hypothetical protein
MDDDAAVGRLLLGETPPVLRANQGVVGIRFRRLQSAVGALLRNGHGELRLPRLRYVRKGAGAK